MRKLIRPKEQVSEAQKESIRRRVFRGYLAETYDGIGQYVLVGLSRGSTAVAYKARIASGDFNTSAAMPIGTPVSVVVYRGSVEIISMGAR